VVKDSGAPDNTPATEADARERKLIRVDQWWRHQCSSRVFGLQLRESSSVCEECAPCIGVRRYRLESSDFRTMRNRRALAPPTRGGT